MKKKLVFLFLVGWLFFFLYTLWAGDYIYCPNCGVKNDFQNNFCKNCGLPLQPIRDYLSKVKGSYSAPTSVKVVSGVPAQSETVSSAVPESSTIKIPTQENNSSEDPIARKLKHSLQNLNSHPKTSVVTSSPAPPKTSLSPKKKQLLNDIESIFNSKSGPEVPPDVVERSQSKVQTEKSTEITRRKMESVPTKNPSSNSTNSSLQGGKLEIVLRYEGDEIDKYDKYGKVYMNGKLIGKVFRFFKQKKDSSYVNYFSRGMEKFVKDKFLNETVYKMDKAGIPPGIYTISVSLRKKIVWGYSRTYVKKWRSVKIEDGIVTKLIYRWNDGKDFGH